VRQLIIAVLADCERIDNLRKQGKSWGEVVREFNGNPSLQITKAEAEAWYEGGFGIWVDHHNRMLITARVDAIERLRGLSSTSGEYVALNRKKDWVGPFIRAQFLKPERITIIK
jgi:hypothetical protein